MAYPFDWQLAFNKAKENDRTLLDEHFKMAYQQFLFPNLISKTKNPDTANEICSIVISKFWERFFLDGEPLPESVENYLFVMSNNAFFYHAKTQQRKMQKSVSVAPENMNFVFNSLQAEEGTDLERQEMHVEKDRMFSALEIGMKKLKEPCHSLLKAVIFEKKRLNKIHADFGIPTPNAASKKKNHCLDKLRKIAYLELANLKNRTDG